MSNTTQPAPTTKPRRARFGCFGIGALIGTGLFILSCLFCGGLGAFLDHQSKEELKRADELWKAGDTEDAAIIYISELEWVDDARLPHVYERIITHYYDSGDEDRAVEYCTTAIEEGIDIRFTREDLRSVFADARQVIEERKAEELARKQAEEARRIEELEAQEVARRAEEQKAAELKEKQAEEQRLAEQKEALPTHKFSPSSRPGMAKAQLRAVIPLGKMTEQEIRELAVRLCSEYSHRASGSFLVQFFASDVALDEWDGTGLLRDTDWPVHLCNVTVETDTDGGLYSNTFGIALDEVTGEPRTDVLRE